MRNRRWLVLVLCGGLMSISATPSPEVKNVMCKKLSLAQNVLEAVVVSDWVGLEANSHELA